MYSREEVETIILSIVNDVAHDEDLIHHYDGDFRNAKEWIKENI